MPGQDGARAMATARRRPWVHGLQHPLCTEKHPLNSCVQLASGWRAYGTSGFSSGISGDPTAACWVYHPDPALGSLSHQASCPQSVPQQQEGEAWGCTQDPANLGCLTSHQESTQWGECLAGPTTTPAAAAGGTPMHSLPAEALEAANRALCTVDSWMLGTGCLQRCWETQNNPAEIPGVPQKRCLEGGPHGWRLLQC